jgi:hypothetical protein
MQKFDFTEYTASNQSEMEEAVTFMARLIPFMVDGKSFEEAGRAVLEQDRKLMEIATSNSDEGDHIRKELAAEVYSQVRSTVK